MHTKARTSSKLVDKWYTFHFNGPYPSEEILETFHGSGAPLLDLYKDAASEIQRLLQECLDQKKGFRAQGNIWSLSHIAHHPQRMQRNYDLNIKMSITPADMHTVSTLDHQELFFFECGNMIKEITNYLEERGMSLQTSGASNQQSIAGAISTGVHGSALRTGAIHDSVLGLNLIVGPRPEDIVYIERSSQPVLSDSFAQKIKARVIRDDDLFHAALVGLGAFGFIHGLVIKAEPVYLIKRYVRNIMAEDARALSTTLDFSKLPGMGLDIEFPGDDPTPYHYKVFINPYKTKKDLRKERKEGEKYLVEFMYKHPYPGRGTYPRPMKYIGKGLHHCLVVWFEKIAAEYNYDIPKLIKLLQGELFPTEGEDTQGTLGEIFWDAEYQGKAFAISFGVDHRDSVNVLDLLIEVANEKGPVPGAFALRFVKGSSAALAFTKYPVTCIVEMDGLQWDEEVNPKMIKLQDFLREMMQKLLDAGIDFTMHWAKNADWKFPGLSERMFGDKVTFWKKQRYRLLRPEMAEVFSNPFLDDTQLSGPPVPSTSPKDVIA